MIKNNEFEMILIEDLETVDFNPNEMSQSQEDHLRKTIKERGFMQPLTVTLKEGEETKFIVIDGAHRLKVYSELGNKTIPCFIVSDKSPIDIKIDLINLNQIKCEFNQKKYAQLLKSLHDDIGIEELKQMVNIETKDYDAYLALIDSEYEGKPGDKKEVRFTVRDLECPECKHRGPKSDFKLRE